MIDLSNKSENSSIRLLGDIVVVAKPLTTESMLAAQNASQRRIAELIEPYLKCKEAGLIPPEAESLDLDDPDVKEGLRVKFLIEEIAIRHIVSWEGVYLNGQPAPLEPEMIAMLMGRSPIGQTFYHEIVIKQVEIFCAKKDGGIVAAGTSAAVPTTAKGAERKTQPAQRAKETNLESSVPTKSTTSEATKKSPLGGFWGFFRVL